MRLLTTVALLAATMILSCPDLSARDRASGSDRKPEFRFRGYVGGMMLHTGYIRSGEFTVAGPAGETVGAMQIKGAAFGIGGQVKFAFGTATDMIRIGSEGHSTNVSYSPSPSYAHTGWGGLIIDYIHRTRGRVHPYAGVTVGGGAAKNHIMADGSSSDFISEPHMAFRKYAFMAVAPFAGVEISLTPKLSLMFKADWILNATGTQSDFPGGPRLYIGIMFNRLQN